MIVDHLARVDLHDEEAVTTLLGLLDDPTAAFGF